MFGSACAAAHSCSGVSADRFATAAFIGGFGSGVNTEDRNFNAGFGATVWEPSARSVTSGRAHLGMNKELGDAAAIAFSVGFYKALGGGRDVEDAYRFGIAELKLLAIPEHLTPVLIKRPDGVKCVVAKRTSIYDKRTSESAVFQCDASRQRTSRRLLVNPAAYPSLEQLLDDIFINLLSDSIPPYTYGSEWIIASSYRRLQALVPLEWLSARSSSIRGVAPSWGKSVSPSDQGIEPGSGWEILLKSGATLNDFTSLVEQAALFGFATNNLDTVHALRGNIKEAWRVGHNGGFTRHSLDTLDQSKYRFRCVFADDIGAGLGGQILVELT